MSSLLTSNLLLTASYINTVGDLLCWHNLRECVNQAVSNSYVDPNVCLEDICEKKQYVVGSEKNSSRPKLLCDFYLAFSLQHCYMNRKKQRP